jgi:hypothetical protein
MRVNRSRNPGFNATLPPTVGVLKNALFYDAGQRMRQQGGEVRRNALFHDLDESWRLDGSKEEVILFGRIPRTEDRPAEEVASSPASPSQLWLGRLPGSGQPRLPLAGKLSQEGYVRVFIPISPAQGQ